MTRHHLIAIASLSGVLLQSGCVTRASESMRVAVPGPSALVAELAPGDRVDLIFEQGEVRVTGHAGRTVQAQVEILCPDSSSRCATRAARTEFVSRRAADGLQISLKGEPGRGAQFFYNVRVPHSHPLSVRLKYGDLTIEDHASDVSARMTAGAIRLDLPAQAFASADLAASVGDARLTTGRQARDGRRPTLVGSKVNWDDGSGEHRASARVRFGDIDASLNE